MLHKELALMLVILGVAAGIATTEAADKSKKKKPIVQGEYRVLLEKPKRRFWGRDVNRGVVTFEKGGKYNPVFIWSRGGSRGVFDFRR